MPESIANPFSAQPEMDIGDDESQRHREREKSISNARSLDDLLRDFDKFSGSTREKGDLFERLVKRILESDPVYKQQFDKVWRWNDWPRRDGEVDTGIDLVAKFRGSDDETAIQCKFYSPGTQVSYADASKFINASFRFGFQQRIFVSTTSNIASKADTTFNNDATRTQLLGLDDLRRRDISWPDIWNPEKLVIKTERYDPRPDQITARDIVIEGFKTNDRGKLILPCGTGKTYTALQIAENLVGVGGKVLYLVPSIALLGQTMREWAEQQSIPHRYLGICSDVKAGRRSAGNEDVNISSLEIPVTTDADKLAPHLNRPTPHALTVVFSTYQSIEQVIAAQSRHSGESRNPEGLGEGNFDLVICDEAHRTTGIDTTSGSGSHFTKVHNAEELKARKRLYMTATPRIYSEAAKNKALQIGQVALYSMDDVSQYGPEFHRMTFHDAVENNLLTDYKVLVLNIEEQAIAPALQSAIAAGADKELPLDDAAKLVGCASALFDPEPDADSDQKQLLRAIAFASRIRDSKRFKENWPTIVNESKQLLSENAQMRQLRIAVDHVDGGMNALERARKIEWLRASEEDEFEIRVLNNARCLTEGVDVPALDAVLFMQPRRSLVDVVQAVGRVMRRAPNKKFGYIILPIVIPAGVDPNDALDDNERYRVVWEVLQALRSHDERLDAEINKIDLQKGCPGDRINVIGVGGGDDEGAEETITEEVAKLTQYQLPGLFINNFRAKVVEKVGDRQYWDRWAKDVAEIHDRLETRIGALIPDAGASSNGALTQIRLRFESLMQAIRATTNEALDEHGAVSIVAQHMITEPVFQALFEGHDFAKSNPVAASLNQFVDLIKQHGLDAELEQLDPFYASVKRRAERLDNAEARRKVLEELYENFFQNALPKEAQRLGVVYTPHEIVDFILRSADFLLRKEFGKSLSDEGVHILDPFAGMGTFIWRLLANPDLIRDEDLERKFWDELHANEILPLAYYMASVNVEEAFRERVEDRDKEDPGYLAFEGMVWRDTFNAFASGREQRQFQQFMADNDVRANNQDKTDINVIIANPPYSVGQTSSNDQNPNVSYPSMHDSIRSTYGQRSRANLRQSLFDHYKMAIRWGTDRLPESGGIIGFVTNASFLDGNADSGLRACLAEESTSIYVLNLRGNQRTQGEISRKEGGKVFGSGSRAPIAITLFVNNPRAKHEGCRIYYKDVGDYLTREQKLSLVRNAVSVKGVKDWQLIKPDENHDWINLRDDSFSLHSAIGDDATKRRKSRDAVFGLYSSGIGTGRDDWVYETNAEVLKSRITSMSKYYTATMQSLQNGDRSINELTRPNPSRIKWRGELIRYLRNQIRIEFDPDRIRTAHYRPFVKNRVYFEPRFIARVYRVPAMFPDVVPRNLAISVAGIGANKPFSTLITDIVPDLELVTKGQVFPRYAFEEGANVLDGCTCGNTMPCGVEVEIDGKRYIRHDNILDEALKAYRSNYDDGSITKDDIFYYVYGLLHSPVYKERYQNNFRRELPRLPMAPDFRAFSKAGRALSDLHLNYETCKEYDLAEERTFTGESESTHYHLGTRKMRWTDKGTKNAIRVNDYFILGNIPSDSHCYVVNGRTPLEWLMDRYYIKTDKDSGIVHDPNKWFEETGDNIVSMIKRITHTSVETAKIIDTLPTPFTDGWKPG